MGLAKPKIVYRRKQRPCVLCGRTADTLSHPQFQGMKVPPGLRAPGICLKCAVRAAHDLLREAGIEKGLLP
jgi:hypothetical protein